MIKRTFYSNAYTSSSSDVHAWEYILKSTIYESYYQAVTLPVIFIEKFQSNFQNYEFILNLKSDFKTLIHKYIYILDNCWNM